MVQLRLKHASTADRRVWLGRCREAIARAESDPGSCLLLVNDDPDAAFASDGTPLADGVHLGREDATAAGGLSAAREQLGSDLLLGTSTRTRAEVAAARDGGCDYVGFGAMATSPTKFDSERADPQELRACMAANDPFPIFAIGGLGPRNVGRLVALGCRRVAVGSAILDANDPAASTAQCLEILRA
jgi:thiamine-phosphate pyrophosphorylase